ncbi:hypothetical protein TEA_018294 [Camellia sinensis var. sinensis]|uniref:histidinol-phosphate transaminase n=1 Tax=Camellia sinensis var. sinensis TaxID=542762 RepID=A0A4S4EGW3_CAMSN|nr:hypothetical protein TEA_018294 [Camellia sinensis var. sinensis]
MASSSSSRGLLTLFPDLNESTRERTGVVALEPQPSAPEFAPLNFPMQSVEQRMAVQSDVEANQYTLKSCVESMTAVTVTIFARSLSLSPPEWHSIISDEVLLKILDLPILVVLDEAYIEFSGIESKMQWVKRHENLIVLRTFSKRAGLAGLRIGYGAFPLSIIEYLWRAKQPYNVSVAAEVSACAALKNPAYLEKVKVALVQERERLFKLLKEVPFLNPYMSYSNFILCEVTSGMDAKKLKALAALHKQDLFVEVPPPQLDVHAHAKAEPSDEVDSEVHVERDFTSILYLRSMLNDWCEIHIRIEDFGNAMTEQHEKGVRYSEEGVSHTVVGALHARDGLTQSPERVPAFTETVIHSEERSHADEQHLQTTHASHEEVLVSAITHSEKRSTQSEDGIPLFTERVTHCGEGGSHVDERERILAFTETVTHSEERGSYADEQHLQTTHASHKEVPVSAITQSEEEGTQSEDGIPLFTKRVIHCGEGGSHVDERVLPTVPVDPVPRRRKQDRHQATVEGVT